MDRCVIIAGGVEWLHIMDEAVLAMPLLRRVCNCRVSSLLSIAVNAMAMVLIIIVYVAKRADCEKLVLDVMEQAATALVVIVRNVMVEVLCPKMVGVTIAILTDVKMCLWLAKLVMGQARFGDNQGEKNQ